MRIKTSLVAVSLLTLAGCEAAPAEPTTKPSAHQASQAKPGDHADDVDQREPATFLAEPGDMTSDVLPEVWPTLRVAGEPLSEADVDAIKGAVKLIRAEPGQPAHYVAADVVYTPPGIHIGEYDHHFGLNPGADLSSGWYVLRLEGARIPEELRQRLDFSDSVGARFKVGSRLMIQSLEVSTGDNQTFITLLFSSRVRAQIAPSNVAIVKADGQVAQCESVEKDLKDPNGVIGLTLKCAALDPKAKIELSFDKGLAGLDGSPCTGLDGKSQCALEFTLEAGAAELLPAAEAASAAGLKVNLEVQK